MQYERIYYKNQRAHCSTFIAGYKAGRPFRKRKHPALLLICCYLL